MFELSKVTVRFGERRVLDSISVVLGPEPVAVMGPSGSGKTTLLSVLAGQLRPDRGSVVLNGKGIKPPRGGGSVPDVALIHQDYRLVDFLSVLDNVLLSSELRGVSRTEKEARGLLARVGLRGETLGRRPTSLSGGEQQRVAIARALLSGATVLLADEPTGALDKSTTVQITDLLLELAESDEVQVVIATHDDMVARRMHRIIHLSDGELRWHGGTDADAAAQPGASSPSVDNE